MKAIKNVRFKEGELVVRKKENSCSWAWRFIPKELKFIPWRIIKVVPESPSQSQEIVAIPANEKFMYLLNIEGEAKNSWRLYETYFNRYKSKMLDHITSMKFDGTI